MKEAAVGQRPTFAQPSTTGKGTIPMTNEMIERVAQALREDCQAVFGSTWNNDVAWRFARIAIEAMREPTDEQRNAYYALSHKTEVMMDAHWERAIDAALAETGSPVVPSSE